MRTLLLGAALLGIPPGCIDDSISATTQSVIGGTTTQAGMYPATGALIAEVQGQRIVFCTGTLIAPDAVVTAAHCLIPPPEIGDFMPSFTLALDANNVTSAELFRGSEKHYHPQYDQYSEPPGTLSRTYDIGIVLLQQPVPGAMPAYLPTPAEAATLAAGMPLEITGYGQTSAADQDSVGVKYDATTTLAAVGPYEIGVGTPGAPQNCHGDSGGPAYIHVGSGLRMVGIVSRGNTGGEDTCDRGGIDTRADAYREWLASYTTLAEPPADPPPGDGSGSGSGSGSGTDPDDDPIHEPDASAGGCAAGHGSGAAVLLAFLGIGIGRRRRRADHHLPRS